MPTRLQSFSNILLSRCSRLSCVTEKRRALLSLPGNRTRSSTGRNQAVGGPAALVGNGGREGIRTPGLLVANEALSQLSYSPTSSKSILAKEKSVANTWSRDGKHKNAKLEIRNSRYETRNAQLCRMECVEDNRALVQPTRVQTDS